MQNDAVKTNPFQDSEGFYTMETGLDRPARFPNPNVCIEFEVLGEAGQLLGIAAEIRYAVHGKTSYRVCHSTHFVVFVHDEKGQRVYFFHQIGRWRPFNDPIPKISNFS